MLEIHVAPVSDGFNIISFPTKQQNNLIWESYSFTFDVLKFLNTFHSTNMSNESQSYVLKF